MRVEKAKLYIVDREIPERHGGGTERCIMRGELARNHRSEIVRKIAPGDDWNPIVRVEDGRLPEFQDRMKLWAFVGDFWKSHQHVAVVVEED